MRADRLLSILLLLQARGRVTARELAAELEVSERTIYRDVDALSAAGVPVFGEPGAAGGYELLDRFRTRLTGLTADEARALFMLSVPAPLARLGVDRHLRSALRKLSAEMPEDRRADEARVHQRFHLDAEWWRERDDVVPHMQALHHAVWDDRKVLIAYRPPFCEPIEQMVEPYGLVAKAGVWYAVVAAHGRLRVHRVSELIDVRETDESFERAPGFDLPAFWDDWRRREEASLSSYAVTVRVSPATVPDLRRVLGGRALGTAPGETPTHDGDRGTAFDAVPGTTAGWHELELRFESFEMARERLLGFGSGVEVLAPEALRRSIADYAQQIVAMYGGRPGRADSGCR